jgi:hypothetical protein
LDDQISQVQVRLSDIQLRERRFSSLLVLYTSFSYIVYVAVYFSFLRSVKDSAGTWIVKLLPVVLGPVVILLLRRLIASWYLRKRTSEETYLEKLKAIQKQKVEELKQKTAYYSTRNLLERYDPTVKKDEAKGAVRENRAMTTGRLPPQGDLKQRVPMTPAQRAAMGQHGKLPMHLQPNTPARVMSPLAQQQGQGPETPLPLPIEGEDGAFLPPYPPASPAPKTFMDRIVDVIVGEEAGPTSKYALICARCFAHNGLALPEEMDDISTPLL